MIIFAAVGKLQHHQQIVKEKRKQLRLDPLCELSALLRAVKQACIFDLAGECPGVLPAAAGGDLVIHRVVTCVAARLADERENEPLHPRRQRPAARSGFLQCCIHQFKRVPHAGEEKCVFIPKIFIDHPDAYARIFCNRCNRCRLKTAAGKFRNTRLQNRAQRRFIQLPIHKTPQHDVNSNSRLYYNSNKTSCQSIK